MRFWLLKSQNLPRKHRVGIFSKVIRAKEGGPMPIERPLMISNIRVGRGVQDSPQIWPKTSDIINGRSIEIILTLCEEERTQ